MPGSRKTYTGSPCKMAPSRECFHGWQEMTPTALSTLQFSPTELTAVISQAISGALNSPGIINACPALSSSEPGTSAQERTLVEDVTSKKLATLANTMAAGRLIFFFDKPHETFSIWANEDIVR